MLVPATAAAGDAPGGVQPNIIGGHAPTLTYPGGAMVSLKYDAPKHNREAWHTCGAAVMDGIHLRTAAHCVTDLPEGLSAQEKADLARHFNIDATSALIPTKDKAFWVRVGSQNRNEGGLIARVTVKWVHPNWRWGAAPGAEEDDVAVLQADQFIDTYFLPLAPRKARPGDTVYRIGWGVTQPSGAGPAPTMIRELKSKIINSSSCNDAGITTREVCVNNPNGTDGDCFGDSGGPIVLVIDGVLYDVGLSSRGAGEYCGIVPTVYTSTPEFRTELYDVMRGTPATSQAQKPPTAPKMTQPFERPGGMS